MDVEPSPAPAADFKPEIAFRKTNSSVVGGVVLRNKMFMPLVVFPRPRSKYRPHQGERERIRRIKQQAPLTTVDHVIE